MTHGSYLGVGYWVIFWAALKIVRPSFCFPEKTKKKIIPSTTCEAIFIIFLTKCVGCRLYFFKPDDHYTEGRGKKKGRTGIILCSDVLTQTCAHSHTHTHTLYWQHRSRLSQFLSPLRQSGYAVSWRSQRLWTVAAYRLWRGEGSGERGGGRKSHILYMLQRTKWLFIYQSAYHTVLYLELFFFFLSVFLTLTSCFIHTLQRVKERVNNFPPHPLKLFPIQIESWKDFLAITSLYFFLRWGVFH